jgi:hypothetical protein
MFMPLNLIMSAFPHHNFRPGGVRVLCKERVLPSRYKIAFVCITGLPSACLCIVSARGGDGTLQECVLAHANAARHDRDRSPHRRPTLLASLQRHLRVFTPFHGAHLAQRRRLAVFKGNRPTAAPAPRRRVPLPRLAAAIPPRRQLRQARPLLTVALPLRDLM